MSRGSFSRAVARAAASGGSRAYRGQSPRAWYALLVLLCAGGIFLVVFSRNERLHPATPAATPPTASDHWYAALGIDLCGKIQPNLPANVNFSTVGIRTAGDGVINIAPGAVSNASAFSGNNATLGTFATYYTGFVLTPRSIQIPGQSKPLANGDECTAAIGPARGVGRLVVRTWSSPSAKHGADYSGNPGSLKLDNGMMVTIGFVPKGTVLPEPRSKKTLAAYLSGSTITPPPTTPTTTTLPATSTTVAGGSTTSSAATSTTAGSGSSTTAPSGSSTTAAGAGATSTTKAKAKATSTTRSGAAGAGSTTKPKGR